MIYVSNLPPLPFLLSPLLFPSQVFAPWQRGDDRHITHRLVYDLHGAPTLFHLATRLPHPAVAARIFRLGFPQGVARGAAQVSAKTWI